MIDADDSPQNMWNAVTARLKELDVQAPKEIPQGGFAEESVDYGARVGVWLMPDNRKTGALEDFLRYLINEADPLFSHAKDSARGARRHHAR